MMRKSPLMVAVSALLAGCVATGEQMIDERSAVIDGGGDGYMTMAAIENGILYRAAVEAKSRGFGYFAIMKSLKASQAGQTSSPQTSTIDTTAWLDCFGQHCSGTSRTTNYSPAGDGFWYFKPGPDVRVRFYHASEVDLNARGLWSADRIIAAHPQKGKPA